jgi:hypothetical protein
LRRAPPPPRVVHDVEIRDQAGDGQSRVRGVEEGPISVAGAPIRARARREPREEARRPRIRRLLVAGLARGPEQLGGREQGAVVVHDVLASVVREPRVVRGEERPGLFGRAQVVGLALARRCSSAAWARAAMARPPPARKLLWYSASSVLVMALPRASRPIRRSSGRLAGPGPDTER